MSLPAHTLSVHMNSLPWIITLWILGTKSAAVNWQDFNATTADCVTVLQLGAVMDWLVRHIIPDDNNTSEMHTDISEGKLNVNSLTCHITKTWKNPPKKPYSKKSNHGNVGTHLWLCTEVHPTSQPQISTHAQMNAHTSTHILALIFDIWVETQIWHSSEVFQSDLWLTGQKLSLLGDGGVDHTWGSGVKSLLPHAWCSCMHVLSEADALSSCSLPSPPVSLAFEEIST